MDLKIRPEQVRAIVLALPQLASWSEVAEVFPASAEDKPVRLDWQLPALACRAVGGDELADLPAVAAIACLQISIILADDILDDDPRGEYHRLGYGRTTNLALAFQAAALALIAQAQAPAEARAAAGEAIAGAALATARGQDLDVQNLQGEVNYWRVVRAKSTPFYGAALQVGALLADADPAVAQGLYDLGVLFGEMIQVFDDLMDAFQSPANPDWTEGRNNLAILYATTADHLRRDELRELLPRTRDVAALTEAQRILIHSGAVSYCVYQQISRYQAARAILAKLNLADPSVMKELLETQIAPLVQWLPTIGVAAPDAIWKIVA